MRAVLGVFFVFLRLGLTSFGGPIAHLGYFHNEFVLRRKWIDEESFTDLVALCQFLPGPASSQVGIAIGLSRAGLKGAIAAWSAFTLPSAALLIAFALGSTHVTNLIGTGWLHGLKIVAVAVVADAVFVMARKMCPDLARTTIAVTAAAAALIFSSAWTQVAIIVASGLFGYKILKSHDSIVTPSTNIGRLSTQTALVASVIFVLLLLILPILASNTDSHALKLFDSFFRVGSLVFGGGHVVLPLLSAEVVTPGWVSAEQFITGYGVAQAVPGPLFTFAGYLGAVSAIPPLGIIGGLICVGAVFLPSFLLIFGALPFWEKLKTLPRMRSALLGINAAVVGLLCAALYNPVWVSAIFRVSDFLLGAICFWFLARLKIPSVAVVIFGALAGSALVHLNF